MPLSIYYSDEYLGRCISFMKNTPKMGIGIKVAQNDPTIPYFMFADNCLFFFFFCKVKRKAARHFKVVLDLLQSLASCQFSQILG